MNQLFESLNGEDISLHDRVRELEQQLDVMQRMLAAAPQVLYVFDLQDHSTIYASRHCTELLECAADEPVQMEAGLVPALMHPDDRERHAAHLAQLATLADGAVIEREYRMQHATGTWRWFLSRERVFTRAADGTPGQIIGVVQDITERKDREQTWHETTERLEFAIEGSSDGIWDWYLPTNDAYLSPGYRQMLGYTADELPNAVESWLNNIHPDDMPLVQQVLQDYLEGRRVIYEVEHRLRHKSGEWLWMLSRGKVVIRDEMGGPVRMTGTVANTTARRQAEDELRLFKTIFENASDPIAIIRASDGIITHYNEAYRAQYRCGDSQLGQSIGVIVAEEDQVHLPGILQQIKEQGVWNGQLTHVRADGTTFPALESCFTITDQKGEVVSMVGIVRDITDVIAAQMQQQIINAQRIAIRELSTPLIPFDDRVVVMPLIGTLDSARAQQVLETLLEGVAQHQADLVIVDITGVQVVDTQVASALVRAAQAVKLLGAQVVLTGIQPRIAQTLVHLGVDLGGIITRGTLQAGIGYALHGGMGRGRAARIA